VTSSKYVRSVAEIFSNSGQSVSSKNRFGPRAITVLLRCRGYR